MIAEPVCRRSAGRPAECGDSAVPAFTTLRLSFGWSRRRLVLALDARGFVTTEERIRGIELHGYTADDALIAALASVLERTPSEIRQLLAVV